MRLLPLRAAALALLATPAVAAKPPLVRAALIRWPGGAGALLHGRMALPTRARGRQPAVLVLGDADRPEIARLVEAIAADGHIACAIRGVASPGDARATIAWLGGNRYATGRVALIATGADEASLADLLAHPLPFFVAAIVPGETAGGGASIPLLRLADRRTIVAEDVPALSAFLKEQLR